MSKIFDQVTIIHSLDPCYYWKTKKEFEKPLLSTFSRFQFHIVFHAIPYYLLFIPLVQSIWIKLWSQYLIIALKSLSLNRQTDKPVWTRLSISLISTNYKFMTISIAVLIYYAKRKHRVVNYNCHNWQHSFNLACMQNKIEFLSLISRLYQFLLQKKVVFLSLKMSVTHWKVNEYIRSVFSSPVELL